MALGKNSAKINTKGFGYLLLREIHPTPSNTFLDLGYVESTELSDEPQLITSTDERGFVVAVTESAKVVTLKAVLMQSNTDVIAFMKAASSKWYDVYYYGSTADAQVQEFNFPKCKITGGLKLSFKANTPRNVPIEIHAMPLVTALAADPGATFDLAADDIYSFVESASKIGPPTQVATVNQSAAGLA